MASFVTPELRNIDGKKRKEQSDSSSSTAGSSFTVEKSETTCKQSKENSGKRKSFLRSSSSKQLITTSTTEEEDDDSGASYSEGRLSDGNAGHFPASHWQYEDLKSINIFYNDNPEPLEELVQNVKIDILKTYSKLPDFEKTVTKFSRLTKENLMISCSIDYLCMLRNCADDVKIQSERAYFRDITSDVEKVKKVDRDLDHTNLLDRKWILAVEGFLFATMSLIKRILYPAKYDDTVKEAKEVIKRKMRKRKHAGRSTNSTEKTSPSESLYQHFCSMFGGLFFLEPKDVDKRTFVVGNKVVNSIPDLAYALKRMPAVGCYTQDDTLLFVVEEKVKPIKNVSCECLEQQIDSGILGQVGCELFAEAGHSVLYPNSLGIICMETRLIFVYLKMPKEHLISIQLKEPIKTEGKIHYTRPFDMLKAEDRAEVCEFMYWLGCVQNHERLFKMDV